MCRLRKNATHFFTSLTKIYNDCILPVVTHESEEKKSGPGVNDRKKSDIGLREVRGKEGELLELQSTNILYY